ncbi:MAG TPA: hypothetical protein VD993_16250 [Chitinophagaceae bacterium]|nr:hypothetical protein [Chitinophagaceae bacterium]
MQYLKMTRDVTVRRKAFKQAVAYAQSILRYPVKRDAFQKS